jgi:hypothetical protein
MATNVIFTRGNTATINATAITDGQILYNTTAGTQYLDNGTTRIQVGQNITVDTTLNSLSNNPIANRGVAGVMMSSLSEISTVTQAGSLPDALAVKELNSNIGSLSFAQGTDGKWGYKVAGADPVIPFKSYYDLGVGTNFNVSSYSGYKSFTAANFVVEPQNPSGVSKSWSEQATGTFSFNPVLSKSYNSANGILTAFGQLSGSYNIVNVEYSAIDNRSDVHAYLLI